MRFLPFSKGRKEKLAGNDTLQASGSAPESSRNVPDDIKPYGIKVLQAGNRDVVEQVVYSIIFVHGLTGHREKTWTSASGNAPWDAGLLPEKLQNIRLMTFGYDADVVRHGWKSVVSQSRIGHHATDLLHALSNEREDDGMANRPIFFVCHSLGGLICKDAMVHANQAPESEPHLRNILHCTRGIAFFGTPHRGSDLAEAASMLIKHALGLKQTNKDIVDVLKQDSEVLSRVTESFARLIRSRNESGFQPIKVICFYEQLPLPFLGQVVPPHSARLEEYQCVGIHANHMDMVKFDGPDDPGFKSFQGELCRWAGSVEQETESRRIEARLKEEVENQELEEKVQDLAKRLEFPAMHQRLNAIRSINPEQSCSWLFENAKYQDWVSCSAASQSAFLIIKGKPGAGKSVGMKAAAGRLVHSHEQSHAKLTIQFFFDGRQNTEPELWQSSLGMYRLLLCELLRNVRPLPEGVLNNEALLRTGNIDAVRDTITAILTTTRTTQLTVYLFLDAIDECKADGGDGSLDMLESLHILNQKLSQTQTSLQVCLSVRSGYKLGAALPKGNIIIVDEHNQADIKAFVQSKLVNVNESGLRVMLERIILEKASGIFQWVDLVIWKILSKVDCETHDELLKHAEELPEDILELYAHLLNSDNPDHAAERLKLFELLLVAREPLRVSLLRDALSSGNSTLDLEKFSQRLTVISSGLVQTEHQQAKALPFLEKSDEGDQGYVVNFIHQTAREFLLSDSGLRRIGMDDEYGVEAQCHYAWSSLCMDELGSADLSAESESCLLQYICRFWMDHMRDSDIIPFDKAKYPDFMIRCGRLRTKQLVRRYHETLHRSSTQNRLLLREETNILVLLASGGCSNLLRLHYLECKCHSEVRKDQLKTLDCALFHACAHQRVETVRVLKDLGCNANAMVRENTALYFACWSVTVEVVKLLLSMGARPDTEVGQCYGLPLHAAVASGHTAVVKTLIQQVSDKNALLLLRNVRGYTALHYAAAHNRVQEVYALLENVDDMPKYAAMGCEEGNTALTFARKLGRAEIVNILKDAGV